MIDEQTSTNATESGSSSTSKPNGGDTPTNSTVKVEDFMDLHHQSSLLESSRRHNMLLPISTLPPEIVCDILRYVAQQREIQPWEYPPTPTYIWIRVTHVYHYWRVIALSDPQLWNTIGLYAIDLMDELLKRAGNTPLDLTITNLEPNSTARISSSVNKLMGALTKARCLRIMCLRRNSHSVLNLPGWSFRTSVSSRYLVNWIVFFSLRWCPKQYALP
ncbi:hypothetical protein QCA50_004687 [Cerrena zonata]|uniref:F-box domain-containing protein n=1 Tax=Cerrena zonata TaxID=2478898 RepID=A0AAW0GM68_9APHY